MCYFMLKSDLPSGNKITSVWDNVVLFSACYSSLVMPISSVETEFSIKKKWKIKKQLKIPGFLVQCM